MGHYAAELRSALQESPMDITKGILPLCVSYRVSSLTLHYVYVALNDARAREYSWISDNLLVPIAMPCSNSVSHVVSSWKMAIHLFTGKTHSIVHCAATGSISDDTLQKCDVINKGN